MGGRRGEEEGRRRDRRRKGRAETHHRCTARHCSTRSSGISTIPTSISIGISAAHDTSWVATGDHTARIAPRHDTSSIAAILRVKSRMRHRTAHIAASRRSSVVSCGIVSPSEPAPSAPGHAIAGHCLFHVVSLAIADVSLGCVRVLVVVEAHLAGCVVAGGSARRFRLERQDSQSVLKPTVSESQEGMTCEEGYERERPSPHAKSTHA